MLNIIRADIYRIVRSKAIYITLAIILTVNILVIGSIYAFHAGVMDNAVAAAEALDPEIAAASLEAVNAIQLDGIRVTDVLTGGMENFLFFLLPIIIVVGSAIFTHGTVKNDIAFGISRNKLCMSKLMLSIGISVIYLVFYLGTGMLWAAFLNGFGAPAPAGHWANFAQVLGAQFVLIVAMICIGTFLVFTTKRTAAVNGAYIAFLLVPALIISLLTMANSAFERLFYFDLTSRIMDLAALRYMQTADIAKALGLGAFYILVTTIGGIALFKRAEIK